MNLNKLALMGLAMSLSIVVAMGAATPPPPASAAASATGPGASKSMPASPSPGPKYSALDHKAFDEFQKVSDKPLSDAQKYQIIKAAKEYRSIIRVAKAILDYEVSKALGISTDELHAREKKVKNLEEQKKQAEAEKSGNEGVLVNPPAK